MEIFLTRKDIRTRLQARLGHVTGDGQAPLIQTQFNEFIRAAALEVYTRCQWVRSQRETLASIGIDQRFLNYPESAGPENILAIGLWDDAASRYWPLHRRTIDVNRDDEPLVVEGGDASAARRAQPDRFECKTQIEFWPRPDQTYQLKIDHTINPDLSIDAQASVVDAETIILLAAADAYDFQGDQRLADVSRGKAEKRIDDLIRWQSSLPKVQRGARNHEIANRRRHAGYIPDSGNWPSAMPS